MQFDQNRTQKNKKPRTSGGQAINLSNVSRLDKLERSGQDALKVPKMPNFYFWAPWASWANGTLIRTVDRHRDLIQQIWIDQARVNPCFSQLAHQLAQLAHRLKVEQHEQLG